MKAPIKKITLTAMFMAIGLVLPFFTGQIPQVGNMMLPMHLPVLLCGLICGWQYGGILGFILPCLRFVLFGMPPLFPIGISMEFELSVYGSVIGLLFQKCRVKSIGTLYGSLILAMLSGRIIWGIVRFIIGGVTQSAFTWQLFMAGAFMNAIPGIILQLFVIPSVMLILNKVGLMQVFKTTPKVSGG